MPVTVPHEGLAQFAEAHSLQCRTGPLEEQGEATGKGAAVTEPTFTSSGSRPRAAVRPFQPFSSLVRIDVGALSHPGHVRPNNEDQFFVTRLSRSLETMLSSLPAGEVPARADEVNYAMIVADGMGGHAAGEVASRLAIGALVSLGLDLPDWFFKIDEDHTPEIQRRVRRIVQQISASCSTVDTRIPRCAVWGRR